MIYWPAFDFSYSLDTSRLLPHLAAIEGFRLAASLRLRPPQWRGDPAAEKAEPALPLAGKDQQEITDQIELRKERALLNNAGKDQAWVKQRFVPGSEPPGVEDILQMHRLVAEGTGIRYDSAGQFRGEGLRVMVGTPEIGIHAGAPWEKLPRLMNQYIQLINGRTLLNMPAAVHALVGHYFFTTIHPFDDGNGRVSRLLAAAILFSRGYNGHGFYALFSYFYHNQERYQRLIYQTQQEPCPDLTDFVAFGLEGLAVELQGINNFIKVRLGRTVEREVLTPALGRSHRLWAAGGR